MVGHRTPVRVHQEREGADDVGANDGPPTGRRFCSLRQLAARTLGALQAEQELQPTVDPR